MPSPSPPDDARRWLAALAARVEDDAALLEALSDDEVAALLAEEDVRPAGVAAAIRRRLREPPRTARRLRWRWAAAATATTLVAALALWVLRPPSPGGASEVLAYRADLVALAAPPTKGASPDPLTAGARDLLAAAEASPPDTALARRAARRLAATPDASRTGEAAFFAALAYRLAGDAPEAARWFRRVPETSPYGAAARSYR